MPPPRRAWVRRGVRPPVTLVAARPRPGGSVAPRRGGEHIQLSADYNGSATTLLRAHPLGIRGRPRQRAGARRRVLIVIALVAQLQNVRARPLRVLVFGKFACPGASMISSAWGGASYPGSSCIQNCRTVPACLPSALQAGHFVVGSGAFDRARAGIAAQVKQPPPQVKVCRICRPRPSSRHAASAARRRLQRCAPVQRAAVRSPPTSLVNIRSQFLRVEGLPFFT
jgi:hypothetical protein